MTINSQSKYSQDDDSYIKQVLGCHLHCCWVLNLTENRLRFAAWLACIPFRFCAGDSVPQCKQLYLAIGKLAKFGGGGGFRGVTLGQDTAFACGDGTCDQFCASLR